jgi:hypothetical protein
MRRPKRPRAARLGSDAILMTRPSCCAKAGLEQVELAAPVHLALDPT